MGARPGQAGLVELQLRRLTERCSRLADENRRLRERAAALAGERDKARHDTDRWRGIEPPRGVAS